MFKQAPILTAAAQLSLIVFPVKGLFIFDRHCEIAPFIFVYLGLVMPSAVTA